MSLLFLAYEAISESPILDSQARGFLARCPFATKYFVVCESLRTLVRDQESIRALRTEYEQQGVRMIVLPRLCKKGSNNALLLCVDLVCLIIVTAFLVLFQNVRVIHARSYMPGIVAIVIKIMLGCTFIFDPRGVLPEELAESRGWHQHSWQYRLWKYLEKHLYATADKVCLVSYAFKKYVESNFRTRAVLYVVPCCVTLRTYTTRKDNPRLLRKKLRVGNRFVVIYSGSLATYQWFEGVAHVFANIKAYRADAFMLVITYESKDRVSEVLSKEGIRDEDYTVIAVDRREVAEYLSAANVGILVRRKNVINQVACPVKAGEYLAAGLPLVASREIGDVSKWIEQYGAGVLIDDPFAKSSERTIRQFVQALESQQGQYSDAAKSIYCDLLNWSKYEDVIHNLYVEQQTIAAAGSSG